MESRIDELTKKLLEEGVERGNAQAAAIVSQAEAQAAKIVEDAKSQAAEIVAQAGKDAKALESNTKSELKMFNAQALSALKTEIANVVCKQVVDESVKGLTDNQDFMQEFMLKLAEKWGAHEDIVISTADADSLKALFARKAKSLLDKGVKIEQVNGKKSDFTVQPADGAYKVNFGEAEFTEYFKNFLRPQLVEMLFNN